MIALLAYADGHSGIVHPRSAPEWSDVALFVVAAAGLWWVRRRLRRRFQKND
ncbi:hypothetical protein ACU5AX_11995 [Sphingomonas sp. XXL09]|uniref:hypothetical protein n=1 Tax=Sphingomonas sp. XXL09 TaxID=3457787 RepID=UPI00406BDBFD